MYMCGQYKELAFDFNIQRTVQRNRGVYMWRKGILAIKIRMGYLQLQSNQTMECPTPRGSNGRFYDSITPL